MSERASGKSYFYLQLMKSAQEFSDNALILIDDLRTADHQTGCRFLNLFQNLVAVAVASRHC